MYITDTAVCRRLTLRPLVVCRHWNEGCLQLPSGPPVQFGQPRVFYIYGRDVHLSLTVISIDTYKGRSSCKICGGIKGLVALTRRSSSFVRASLKVMAMIGSDTIEFDNQM